MGEVADSRETRVKERNPGIEVMRCLLMFLIVFYHGCNNGPFQVRGEGYELKIFSWLLFFATNSFMFISGWFGIRCSWSRLLKFLSMGVFASVVLLLVSRPLTGAWHYRLSLGWFGNSYLAVMMLAPLVNAAIDALGCNVGKAWLLYAAMMAASWLPIDAIGISMHVPGWSGHAFNTMMFIYVSARVARVMNVDRQVTTRRAAIVFAVAIALHLSRLLLIRQVPQCRELVILSGDYDAPEMLLAGAAFFFIFLHVGFPAVVGRVCVYLAPSMFVVYLLHSGCSHIGNLLLNTLVRQIYGKLTLLAPHLIPPAVGRFSSVLLGSILVFFGCVLLDVLLRRTFTNRKLLWRTATHLDGK